MNISTAISYFTTSLQYEQLSKHTLKAYAQDLDQWQKTVDQEDLEALTLDDFQNYLLFLHSQNLKVASLRRKRVVLHRFLSYCYKKKLCTQDLSQYIDPIKLKKNTLPKEVLSTEEIQKIFDYIKKSKQTYLDKSSNSHYYQMRYYCMIRNELLVSILLYTGCRAQEAVSLKKSDIQFESNTLTLLTKGSKYNTVPIHPQLKEAFNVFEESIRPLETISWIETLLKSTYLFPSQKDPFSHLSTRTLHDFMKQLGEVIHRPLHAHIFRHTFASYCIAAQMDIATISSLISHSNPSITLSIYTHEIDSMQKQREITKLKF